jgi:hypothetical protein
MTKGRRWAVERVAFPAGFDLDELCDDFKIRVLRETGQRFALRFNAKTGATLLACADPYVSDNRFHEQLGKFV